MPGRNSIQPSGSATDELTAVERENLHLFYLTHQDKNYRQLVSKRQQVYVQQRDIRRRSAVTHVMQERERQSANGPHSLSRPVRSAAPGSPAQCSCGVAAHACIFSAQPVGFGPVAGRPIQPADSARYRESFLAGALWHRLGQVERRLRLARAGAVTSGVARLAGRRVSRIRMGRQEILQAVGDIVRVPAVRSGERSQAKSRSREPAAVARSALPHGWRDGARLCPCGQRASGARHWRTQREALPTSRYLGNCGHDRQQHSVLQARHAATSSTGAASTPSGSAALLRHPWRFSERLPGRVVPCAANEPTLRCRPWWS